MNNNSSSDKSDGSGGGDGDHPSGMIRYITEFRPNDVLTVKGWASFNRRHHGNVHFRKLVSARALEYHAEQNTVKDEIVKSIADSVFNSNGRFLRQVVSSNEAYQLGVPEGTAAWVLMDQSAMMLKIQRTLQNTLDETRVNCDSTAITELNPNDVLFCEKFAYHNHVGNVQFRKLVSTRAAEYHSSGRKGDIINSIVTSISDKNGRFLQGVATREAGRLGVTSGTTAWSLMCPHTLIHEIQMALKRSQEGCTLVVTTEPRPGEVGSSDVLVYHGNGTDASPGNVQYQKMLVPWKDKRFTANKQNEIAEEIVATVIGENGRFLRLVDASTHPETSSLGFPSGFRAWLPIGRGEAIVHTLQNLGPSRSEEAIVTKALFAEHEGYDIYRIDLTAGNARDVDKRFGTGLITSNRLPPGLSALFPGYTTFSSVFCVLKGSYAEKAGLVANDVLCWIDNGDVNEQNPCASRASSSGLNSTMFLMTEPEFEVHYDRLRQNGFFALYIARKRSTSSDEQTMEKRHRDSCCRADTHAQLPSSKHRRILPRALPEPVEDVFAAQQINGRGPLSRPPEKQTHDVEGTMGNDDAADWTSEETKNASDPNSEDMELANSALLCGEHKQARPQQSAQPGQVLHQSTETNGKVTTMTTADAMEHNSVSNTATEERDCGFNQADEPRNMSVALPTGPSPQRENEAGLDKVQRQERPAVLARSRAQVQTGTTSPDLADATMQATEDSEWEAEGLALCGSKLLSIRECNIRLLTQHYELDGEIGLMVTELSSDEPSCQKGRPKPLVRPPLPPKDSDDLETLWYDWYTSLDTQNESLPAVIERQQEQVVGLRQVKQQLDQSKSKAEESKQKMAQLQKELEELRDETHEDKKKSAQLKKAALANLFAE